MEFSVLLTKIDEFNNYKNSTKIDPDDTYSESSKLKTILTNSIPEFDKKNYRGNQYELDQFNWEIQKAEYFSKLRKERLGIKKKKSTEVDNLEELQTLLANDQYSKKWNKLDLYCKKQKFKEYIKHLIMENKIDIDEEKIYLNYLFKMLTKKVLTKGTAVDYDIEKQLIIKIPILDDKIKALSS